MTYQLPVVIEKGGRHNELFKYACSLQAKGLEDNEITESLLKASNENCTPPYPKNETIGIIKSVTNKYPKHKKRLPLRTALLVRKDLLLLTTYILLLLFPNFIFDCTIQEFINITKAFG